MKNFNIKGDLKLQGPFKEDLIIDVTNCRDIIINGEIAGDCHINVQGNVNSVNAQTNIGDKNYISFIEWLKRIWKFGN